MGSRLGKSERRARRQKRAMASGAEKPQKAPSGGSAGKRIEAAKRKRSNERERVQLRLCCSNDAERKATTERMVQTLLNARLEQQWVNGAWEVNAPMWFVRKFRPHLHHLPDEVRQRYKIR